MADNLLRVQPIRNGTVIDHIKPGRGKKILDVLELSNSGTTISLLINVASKKKKRKDIIKVEDREIQEEIQKQLKMMPGQEKMVMEYYQKNPSAVSSLRGALYEEKIILGCFSAKNIVAPNHRF